MSSDQTLIPDKAVEVAASALAESGGWVATERTYAELARAALEAAAPILRDASRTELRDLLSDLAEFGEDPCEFDHHGYCQTHGWTAAEPRCPFARVKEFLADEADL